MKCSLDISNFLEELSSLFHSIVPPTPSPFFLLFHIRRLFSPYFLWNSAFRWVYLSFSPLPFASFPFLAISKASSDNNFAFLHFFFLVMVLITSSCTMSRISVHSSWGNLSDLVPWICLSLTLYHHKRFDLGHTWITWLFSLLSSI